MNEPSSLIRGRIENTWENSDQPPDNGKAGDPFYYYKNYKLFQCGLTMLRDALSERLKDLLKKFDLGESLYREEEGILNQMIEWGNKELSNISGSDFSEITVSGVSFRSLRYLKAGILFYVLSLLEKEKEERNIPTKILNAHHDQINKLLESSESGLMKELKPADIFFELLDTKFSSDSEGVQKIPSNDKTNGKSLIGIKQYDAFICHASEDKDHFVRPFVQQLEKGNAKIWYDEFELEIGDSLRQSIDKGLVNSRYGIVILSRSFFSKNWTKYELDGLTAKEINGEKVTLPIWHDINKEEVLQHSPTLADKCAADSKTMSIEEISSKIIKILNKNKQATPRA
jgi:hypothetical protein